MDIASLKSASKRSFEYSERHITVIAVVCIITLPLSAFVERVVADPSYDTLPIRITAGLVGGALLLHKKAGTDFHYYWTFTFAYTLPFCFGTMLLLNAAYTPTDSSISSIWIYQYLVALFFFVQLIHHLPLTILLWVIASSVAWLPILFIETPNWDAIKEAALLPFPIYLSAVAIGSLLNRNVAVVQMEKLRVVSAIGANLAHELRTPLASIRSLSRGASNLLPALMDAYTKARDSGIEVEPLRESQIQQLRTALGSIQNEVAYSNTVIDMLLVNTADKSLSDVELDKFLAGDCVREAIERYPFNNRRERELINFDPAQDFELYAPRLLIIHVLFNLIKNALMYVQKAGKGTIEISFLESPGSRAIVVHDTGCGISNTVRQHIFERFYTTSKSGQGAGIGLSFCRMVMDTLGGSITCQSEEGEFTTFTLHFPTPRD